MSESWATLARQRDLPLLDLRHHHPSHSTMALPSREKKRRLCHICAVVPKSTLKQSTLSASTTEILPLTPSSRNLGHIQATPAQVLQLRTHRMIADTVALSHHREFCRLFLHQRNLHRPSRMLDGTKHQSSMARTCLHGPITLSCFATPNTSGTSPASSNFQQITFCKNQQTSGAWNPPSLGIVMPTSTTVMWTRNT